MENEILNILKQMQSDMSEMKNSIKNLEAGQDELKKDVSGLKQDVSGLKQDVSELKQDVKELNRKMDAVYDQTADLTEFKTEVNGKLDRLCDLENVTKTNCFDIAMLKSTH